MNMKEILEKLARRIAKERLPKRKFTGCQNCGGVTETTEGRCAVCHFRKEGF
jgi:hypothetical protein